MSDKTTGQNTATTALAALKKKPVGKRDGKPIEEHFFTELYKQNLAKIFLKGEDFLLFDIPDTIEFTVSVQFYCTQKEFDYLISEGVSPFVQALAQRHAEAALNGFASSLVVLNGQVDAKRITADDASKLLRILINEVQTGACKQVAMDLERSVVVFTKRKRAVKVSKIRAIAGVVTDVISIAGHIGHAAASWGGTSPIAVVMIARSCVSIVQTVGIALAKADHIAFIIDGYFLVLDGLLRDMKSSDSPKIQKLINDGAEIGLAAVSAVLGVKGPSIPNCIAMIKEYRVKITEIELKVQRLSPQISEMIDLNGRIAAEVAKIPVTNSKDAQRKADLTRLFNEQATQEFTKLFDKVTNLNKQIVKGYQQANTYGTRVQVYADSTHTVTQWAGTVFSLGINTALGASFPEEALVRGLEAVCEVMEEANTVLIEHFK